MRVELEEEVCDINEDENNRATTTELEEKGSFKGAIDSTVQPFVLSERSETGMRCKMGGGSLRMRLG